MEEHKKQFDCNQQRKFWICKHNELVRNLQSPSYPREPSLSVRTEATDLSSRTQTSHLCQRLNLPITTSSTGSSKFASLVPRNKREDQISEVDEKIINLMILRREAKITEDEIAATALNMWHRDIIQFKQMVANRQNQWRQYLAEKRKFDKLDLDHRRRISEEANTLYINNLFAKIQDRQSRFMDKRLHMRNEENFSKDDSDVESLVHKLRIEHLAEERCLRTAEHLKTVLEKEKQAEFNLEHIRDQLNNRLQEKRTKREVQVEAAKATRDAHNREQAERAELLQSDLTERLKKTVERAAQHIDVRREYLRRRNTITCMHHEQTLAMLKEEEKARELRLRQQLWKKDCRIKDHLKSKDNLRVGRITRALAAANVRHQIRIMFPLNKL